MTDPFSFFMAYWPLILALIVFTLGLAALIAAVVLFVSVQDEAAHARADKAYAEACKRDAEQLRVEAFQLNALATRTGEAVLQDRSRHVPDAPGHSPLPRPPEYVTDDPDKDPRTPPPVYAHVPLRT